MVMKPSINFLGVSDSTLHFMGFGRSLSLSLWAAGWEGLGSLVLGLLLETAVT